GPDVLDAEGPCPVGREDHLATVPAHVRLDVVRARVVQLGDGRRGAERESGAPTRNVDLARDGGGAAREVQLRPLSRGHVRGTLLVQRAVRAFGRAGKMLRLAPAVPPAVAGEVDVAESAASRERLPAHEEEATAPNGRGAEIVGGRVDRLAQVLGRAPRVTFVLPVGDPDVEVGPGISREPRTARGEVQAETVRRLDRATVDERRVQLR